MCFSFFDRPPLISDLPDDKLYQFTFKDLKQATNRFSVKRLIGRGGFGNVYKATFVDAQENEVILAVKRLNQSGTQGYEEFVNEVFLASQNHPNLVKTYGYCNGDREAILVYEFMNGGNLNVALNDSIAGSLEFSWSNRIKVAQNVASALKFLHENDIIHRDLKASNVLLDEHFTAKLSDLGLMRVMSEEDHRTWVQTRIMGSEAYIDPSYLESGILHQKSDVYAFGVLLFELVTGKRANKGNSSRGGLLLETLETLRMPEVSAADFMDPQLSGDYDKKQAMTLVSLARKCTMHNAKDRPPISEAFDILTSMMQGVTPAEAP